MLIITESQLARMGEASFVARLRRVLMESFPEEIRSIPAAELDAQIRQAHRAEAYGLKNEVSVATFVATAWMLGPDFDTRFDIAHTTLKSIVAYRSSKSSWLQSFSAEPAESADQLIFWTERFLKGWGELLDNAVAGAKSSAQAGADAVINAAAATQDLASAFFADKAVALGNRPHTNETARAGHSGGWNNRRDRGGRGSIGGARSWHSFVALGVRL